VQEGTEAQRFVPFTPEDAVATRVPLHVLFCTKERCPFCEGQPASCGCIHPASM